MPELALDQTYLDDHILRPCFSVTLAEVQPIRENRSICQRVARYGVRLLETQLETSDDAFVSSVFHALTLIGVVSGSVPQHLVEQIKAFLRETRFDVGHRPVSHRSRFVGLLKTKEMPADIYSTVYATKIFGLLGEPLDEAQLEPISGWLLSNQSREGWFFTQGWADTDLERKFESELTGQTLLALLFLLNASSLHTGDAILGQAASAAAEFLPRCRYMESLYEATKIVQLGDPSRLSGKLLASIVEFIDRHLWPGGSGFVEYLFEEAKIDEVSGQLQRFKHDQLQPSIMATYRALQVIDLLKEAGATGTDVTRWTDSAGAFFSAIEPSEEGAGTPILIARYSEPFGPSTTPLETNTILLAPSLLRRIETS